MATLTQLSDEYMVINGWYGKCHDDSGEIVDLAECPEFDLTSVTDKIRSVYWIKSDNTIATFNAGAQESLQDFTKLKCGAAYFIYLQKGTGTIDIPNFVPSYIDAEVEGRITDVCDTSAPKFVFDAITSVSEELDEEYVFGGSQQTDSKAHTNVIKNIVEATNVSISADEDNIQYSVDGTSWYDVAVDSNQTISENFANLQLRTKPGLQSQLLTRIVTLTANPVNTAYKSLVKTITYTSTINNVTISANKNISEEVEEGKPGKLYSFEIAYENLKSIEISGGSTSGYQVSLQSTSNYATSLVLENSTLSASPITVYVKLANNMGSASISNVFQIKGVRRNSGGNIVLTNSVTANATLSPKPQISSLSVSENLAVSIAFTNRENYNGTRFGYTITKSETPIVSGFNGFDNPLVFNGSVFAAAGDYLLTAFVVNSNDQKISGSLEKTTTITISSDEASLSLSDDLNLVQDIDDSLQSYIVTINSNNVENIAISPASLTNWEYTVTEAGKKFTLKLKDSVKSLDLSSGFVTLAQESITVTADVGDRDTSGKDTLSATMTLDAKIVDNAEFKITPPNGQTNSITDTRTYTGSTSDITTFGPYTMTFDAVTISTSSGLINWEVKVGDAEFTKDPDFSSVTSGTSLLFRQSNVAVGTYNETFVLTPNANQSDYDASNDPSAISFTLNGKINALSATLNNPGGALSKISLTDITSGETPSIVTTTVVSSNVKSISVSEVSSGWSVVLANDNSTITTKYTGDSTTPGEKSGTFKISAVEADGAVFTTASTYTVNLSLEVVEKTSTIVSSSNSIALNKVIVDTTSDKKQFSVSGNNLAEIEVTTIPSVFALQTSTDGTNFTAITQGQKIASGTELYVSLSDISSLGLRNADFVFTGTSSANSTFNNASTTQAINVTVTGDVEGVATSLGFASPSDGKLTSNADQYKAIPNSTLHQVTLTRSNLETITITGNSSFIHKLSKTNTSSSVWSDSITLNSGESVFYVKLNSTQTSGEIVNNFVIKGTKIAKAESNPADINLAVTANISPFVATMALNPTEIIESYDSQDDGVIVREVTISTTNIGEIGVTADNRDYDISVSNSANAQFAKGLTLTSSQRTFYVKLNKDIKSVDSAFGEITIVGQHELGGGLTTKILNCSATISSQPDKLWVGFAKDASTFYTWHQLEAVESVTNKVTDLQIDDKVTEWNTSIAPTVELLETVEESVTFNTSKHSLIHDKAVFTVFGGVTPNAIPSELQDFFGASGYDNASNMRNALNGATITKREISVFGGAKRTVYDITWSSTLDHTQFKFTDYETFYSKIMEEIGASGQLAYAMMTASPTQPITSSLSNTQKEKTYNNNFVRLKCGDVWNGDQSDGSKKAILKAVFNTSDDPSQNIPGTVAFTASVSSTTLITEGTWSGTNALFASGTFDNSNGRRPRIDYFYFETQTGGNKLKFSTSQTAQPQC